MDNNQQKPRKEEFTINGEDVVGKVKDLLREGNIRRLSIRNEQGKTLIEVPLSTGGAVAFIALFMAPVWAAIAAIAAVAAKLTIVVERMDAPAAQPEEQTGETRNLSQP